MVVFVSHPEVELVDAPRALEACALPSLAVDDKATLGSVHDPISTVARGTHGGEWAANFRDLVEDSGVLTLVGLNLQDLFPHVRQPVAACRYVALATSGSVGLGDVHVWSEGGRCHTVRRS